MRRPRSVTIITEIKERTVRRYIALAAATLAVATLGSDAALSRAAPAPVPAATGSGDPPAFTWPVRSRHVVAQACTDSPGRRGINIAAPEGAIVRAAADGLVLYAGDDLKNYGNVILIRHRNGWVTAYAYNKKMLVKRGDRVRQGQPIAAVGLVAAVSFPQLHFEVRRNSELLDPANYLPIDKPGRRTVTR
jgi:murein DD-endopeptidase MepM/ murein hydrolase activator NlpD